MSERDDRRNAKLGFFVLIGIIVFLVGIFFIGSARNLFTPNLTLYVLFNNVSGLQRGNNVWLSGVKIGTVRDVDIATDELVLVTLSVREKDQQYINRDAKAYLSSEGLVGNAIIVIEPGAMPLTVNDGDTIAAKYVTSTDDIIDLAERAGNELIDVATNLDRITEQILEGEGVLGTLLKDESLANNLENTMANLEATTQRTKRLTGEVTEIVNALQNNRQGPLYTLMNDTTFAGTYRAALGNIEETTANAVAVSQELERLSAKLQQDDNAISVLLDDPDFARNLQLTLRNAATASDKLDENLEALQSNFLFRRYFRKKEKREERARRDSLERLQEQR